MNLKKLVDKRASYSTPHIVKTLFLVEKEPQGRFKLMKELNLGEATVKTLLKNLVRGNLLKSTKGGVVFTALGKKTFGKIKGKMEFPVRIDANDYTDRGSYKNKFDSAILVKNEAKKIRSGIEQRDIAVKAGAIGATTLTQKNDKITFPSKGLDVKKFGDYLRGFFEINDNDVIVICSAPSYDIAEYAALEVGLSLISELE
jgi:predicted transcriptional regulator